MVNFLEHESYESKELILDKILNNDKEIKGWHRPVDNRPSTNLPTHFVPKKLYFIYMNVTLDT